MARHRSTGPGGLGWFWIPILVVVVFVGILCYLYGVNNVLDWFVDWLDNDPAT